MMIFRVWSVWFIDNFIKMLQLNRKYPTGAAKRRKKQESIYADEKHKSLLDRFFVITSGTGEPTEESTASSTQVVDSSYVCLVHNQMCHTQKWSFVKMKLIITCFRIFVFLSKEFFFMSLKWKGWTKLSFLWCCTSAW